MTGTGPAGATYDEHGRPEPPTAGGELETLLGFLEFHRATFRWKTAGLDAAGLDATVGRSSMTLGGMLKHLAYVEAAWFERCLHGSDLGEPWASADWSDPDWDWVSAADDPPDRLRTLWEASCARSRELVTEALAEQGSGSLDPLDMVAARPFEGGEGPTLRWILVHMVEEYARHNGHADLLREAVDGSTGE